MTNTSLFKECNFKAIKAKQPGAWTLCYHDSLESAKSWISPCDHFVIFDTRNDKEELVESKNWDIEDDSAIWVEEETTVNSEVVDIEFEPINDGKTYG